MFSLAHKPVMLKEMIEHLKPKPGERYLDATFGAGGYSQAILEHCECEVYAVDRDPSASKFAEILRNKFGSRFEFAHASFADLGALIAHGSLNGAVFDLGVSSMQLEIAERGFSFDSEHPLDMRMDNSSEDSVSAFDVVNQSSEAELARILSDYGGEKRARAIAKEIVKRRARSPIKTCAELAQIARSKYPTRGKIDSATRTFQAIRIEVNQELEQLERALDSMSDLLMSGARLIAVSFHSLEDALVKRFLKPSTSRNSRYLPDAQDVSVLANFSVITSSPIVPSDDEIKNNPRSRSAKMRVALRT